MNAVKQSPRMWSDKDVSDVHDCCLLALRHGERDLRVDATRLALALQELLAYRARDDAMRNKHGLPRPFDGDMPRDG